jgi:hypothetical protein
MGEGVSAHITKGVVNKKVDALLNEKAGGQFHRRAAFLTAVTNAATAQAYLTILRTQAGVLQEESDYMRDTWYEEGPDGLWPWLQPIYPILRRGLVRTIEVAQQANLPVDTYWIASGDQVEVHVAQSAQQVTRVVMTPPTYAPMKERTVKMNLWSVQHGSAQEVVGRATKDAVIVDVQPGGVVTWQIKEF